jgi:hypothetical protein
MLNSGKKIRVLRDKKKKILTLVLSEKIFLKETKNHNPPLQVKWSVRKGSLWSQPNDSWMYINLYILYLSMFITIGFQ